MGDQPMPWPLYMPTAALTFAVAVGASAASPALGAEPGRQTLDETFAPYAELLDRHLFEKALPNGGLVSAFDYQAALTTWKPRPYSRSRTNCWHCSTVPAWMNGSGRWPSG